jgi:pimeloyl-ACP methyl ester carboxylesterase
MSAILLGNNLVHYEVLGRGRPIILLHGWVGSWRYWIPTMQAASISFRTYALDFWGFGDTAKNQNYSIQDQAMLLDQFMEQMGMMKVALVGHGLGAVVAMQFALKNPGMVDRVLAVSYPLVTQSTSQRLRTSSAVDLVDWLLGKGPETEPVRTDAPKNDSLAVRTSLLELATFDLKTAWHQLQTNCVLVHGVNDPAITQPTQEQFAELPMRIHAVTFDQSGHFPMLDESSKFNRLLVDFLALDSSDSPRELQLKEEWKRRMR